MFVAASLEFPVCVAETRIFYLLIYLIIFNRCFTLHSRSFHLYDDRQEYCDGKPTTIHRLLQTFLRKAGAEAGLSWTWSLLVTAGRYCSMNITSLSQGNPCRKNNYGDQFIFHLVNQFKVNTCGKPASGHGFFSRHCPISSTIRVFADNNGLMFRT